GSAMPVPALVTAIGTANANSYRTLAEADSFFEARLDGENWASFSGDKRTQALLKSAKRLNQINWLGSKINMVQALAWPRVGVLKRDSASVYTYGGYYGSPYPIYGEEYRADEIPEIVKDAQCEFAFEFLKGFNDGEEDDIDSFSADGLSVKFRQSREPGDLPAEVARLISGLIVMNRLMRG